MPITRSLAHECKYKKARSYGTYYIKMLLSTNIHCIEAKYRARKRRESDIKLQFQESHKSINWAIHPAKQTHWHTDREKHTLKETLHWYVEFLPLKYPLLVSFQLPHEDIILPKKKKTKNKNQTLKKHYYYRIEK